MDDRQRRRGMYVTQRQKRKLVELVTKHPQLISCKVTQDFNYRDSQKLWQSIANECNNVPGPGPGAKKTWRQWRKTWQDLRSKTKKRQAEIGEVPPSLVMLSAAEQEALGLKNVSSTTSYQEATEFVPLDPTTQEEYNNEMDSTQAYSEPESPPEVKVFISQPKEHKVKSSSSKNHGKHQNNCFFNCDLIASSEQRKMQLKEDYINFKKDYLRQKLKLIKEQTEALKSIARELSK